MKINTNDPRILMEFVRRGDVLPECPTPKVAYCHFEELPEDVQKLFPRCNGGCLALSEFIWVKRDNNSQDPLLVFWHEVGHYLDHHCHEWFAKFIAGLDADDAISLALIGEDYEPHEEKFELRAWLFAFKITAPHSIN